MNPKVSIIIPVYNGSNYLKEAIDSALGQTYKNIEVIVVNDGSDDNGATRDIALKYAEKIIYIEKENGGVASALNIGIKKMSGDFFSWLSHDDVYMTSRVENLVNFVIKNNIEDGVVYTDYEIIDDISNELRLVKHSVIENESMIFRLLFDNSFHGCTFFIPSKILNSRKCFSEDYVTTQDYHCWFCLAMSYKFHHYSGTTIKARHHNEQGSLLIKTHADEVNMYYIDSLKTILVKCDLSEISTYKSNEEALQFLAKKYENMGLNKTKEFVLEIIGGS